MSLRYATYPKRENAFRRSAVSRPPRPSAHPKGVGGGEARSVVYFLTTPAAAHGAISTTARRCRPSSLAAPAFG